MFLNVKMHFRLSFDFPTYHGVKTILKFNSLNFVYVITGFQIGKLYRELTVNIFKEKRHCVFVA